jgi:hypothetical protein
MKALLYASVLALGAFTSPLQATTSIVAGDERQSVIVFDEMGMTAPKTVFETLNESAPRSDGVFGELERNAP